MNLPDIPRHTDGESHDTVSVHCANTIDMAIERYGELESRLTSVNEWHSFSDKVKAEFCLVDPATGRQVNELKEGILVRIDIPGIGNPSGHGFDWTEIIDVQSESNDMAFPYFMFTLRPSPPADAPDSKISHFYTEESTNTFIVRRVGTCIYAEVHGRNERENTSDVPLMDSLRNKAVAVGGKLGLGKINWFGFTEALLKPFEYK